jgi:hypothetical protein
MHRYLVTLESGRNFIMKSSYNSKDPDEAHSLAYEAMDEAALMDDYLENVELIPNA